MIVYILWVNSIYFNYNIWVYPVLEVMNWAGRIAFFAFSTSVAVFFYVVGEKLNSLVWSKQLKITRFNKNK